MDKWALIIDVAACTNCQNCVVATQDEYAGNAFPGYSAPGAVNVKTLDVTRYVRGEGAMVDVHHVPRMCNHCDAAPCIKASGGVITKRDDGIVIIDPDKAKGRRDLVESCPYGAIVWNDAEQVPQNWIFDAHLLDQGWSEPRAAHVCPTRAIRALKASDAALEKMAQEEGLKALRPELGTRPRVFYRHLEPVLTHFIGGTVTANGANIEEAEVELWRDGRKVAGTRTDAFGDFRIDGIAPGSAGYTVRVTHPQYGVGEAKLSGVIDTSRVIAVVLA